MEWSQSSNGSDAVPSSGEDVHVTRVLEELNLSNRYIRDTCPRAARLLGKGTTGTVWKAFDVWHARHVAIKHVPAMGTGGLRRGMTGGDSPSVSDATRTLREGLFNVELRGTPSVVEMHDVHGPSDAGDVLIVFELMACGSLRDRLQHARHAARANGVPWGARQCFSLPQVKVLMRDVFSGLAAIHDRGIVHRDVKPDNMMLYEENAQLRLKLCDFGMARSIYETTTSSPSNTWTSYVVTWWYRAPEVDHLIWSPRSPERSGALPPCAYTEKIDVFSAGCVMVEALAVDPMYAARKNDRKCKQLRADLVADAVRTVRRRFGEEAAEVLGLMLREDPAERPPARELLRHPFFADVPRRRTQQQQERPYVRVDFGSRSLCPAEIRRRFAQLASETRLDGGGDLHDAPDIVRLDARGRPVRTRRPGKARPTCTHCQREIARICRGSKQFGTRIN